MHKLFLISGSLLGALAVIFGAFGAHALKSTLELSNRVATYQTAVSYHFYHALGLILLGLIMTQFQSKYLDLSGYAFLLGMLFFSGSLYVLSLSNISLFGAIAPIGGTLLVAGWVLMFLGILKSIA